VRTAGPRAGSAFTHVPTGPGAAGLRGATILIFAKSGGGKSTLAAALARNGIRVADEIAFTRLERVVFQEVVPLGRALDGRTEYPSLSSLHALQDTVANLQRVHGEGRAHLLSVSIQEEMAGGPIECSIDAPVRKSCEIRPDGNVLPCSPAAALGVRNMIAEKGLAACWRDLPALYSRYATAEPAGPCVECVRASSCSGGCRALFRTANADPDLRCRFRDVAGRRL